jgi:acetyl-CoA acetyltransferase
MYDTALGWRFINPRMDERGHTDSLGMTAENLAEERFEITAEEQEPERLAGDYDISRERQDRFALGSHQKAVRAMDEKKFRDEIVPVKTRKSETQVEADEGSRRDTSLEKLSKLKPAFKEGGTVVLTSADYAEAHGLEPLAKIKSTGVAGDPPRVMGIGVGQGIAMVVERGG